MSARASSAPRTMENSPLRNRASEIQTETPPKIGWLKMNSLLLIVLTRSNQVPPSYKPLSQSPDTGGALGSSA